MMRIWNISSGGNIRDEERKLVLEISLVFQQPSGY